MAARRARFGGDVERSAPAASCAASSGLESFTATGGRAGERGDGIVLPMDVPAVDDRMPAARRSAFVSCSASQRGGEARRRGGAAGDGKARPGEGGPLGADGLLGRGGHLPQPGGVGRRRLQRAAQARPCAKAGDGGTPASANRQRGGVVEQFREGGGDEDAGAGRAGAVADAVLDHLPARAEAPRGPAGGRRRRAPGRCRGGADDRDEVALPLAVAPTIAV